MTFEALTVITLFPVLLPVWQQRPINHDDLYPSEYPVKVSDELIQKQREAFPLVDADLRGRLAAHLRLTCHPQAAQPLHELLRTETKSEVLTTALQQLRFFPTTPEMAAEIAPFLKHKDTAVREAAVVLFGQIPDADFAAIRDLAMTDAQDRVRMAAWLALRAHPQQCLDSFLQDNWPSADSRVRALALAAGLVNPKAATWRGTFVKACGDESVIVRKGLARAVPGTSVALGQELLGLLSKDAHATVRIAVVESIEKRFAAELLPILLLLADDPDPEVRRVAMRGLAIPGAATAAEKALGHFGDVSNQVREQSEETAVILDGKTPIVPGAGRLMTDAKPVVRYHSCRVLGRLNAQEYIPQLSAQLAKEELPANITSVLFALTELKASGTSAVVFPYASHASSMVRAQTALAFGAMAVPDTYAKLAELVFDKAPDVRQAALLSVGRLADGYFNPTILRVLHAVQMNSGISGRDRGVACWAAGRTRPIAMDVMKRLVVQGTTPVIPTDMGPVFEDETVLISVDYALAECARKDKAVTPLAMQVIKFHSTKPAEGAPMSMGSLVPTPELMEYARQAQLFLEDKKVDQRLRPTQEIYLPYRPLPPRH